MTERNTSEQDWASNVARYPVTVNKLFLPSSAPPFVELTGITPTVDRILTIPLLTSNSEVLMSTENQTLTGLKTFSGSIRLQNAGGGISFLNYYEELLSPIVDNFTFSGGPTSVNISFIRTGRFVMMNIAPNASFNVTVVSVPTSTAGIIPARFRPTFDSYFLLQSNGGGSNSITLRVQTNGTISIGNNPTSLGGALNNIAVANVFIQEMVVSWFV